MKKEKKNNAHGYPTLFSVSIGGFTGSSFSIENSENGLRYASFDYGYSLNSTEEIVPTVEEWQAFKRALDKIGVWEWEHEYPNPGICDGTSWCVKIRWGNMNVFSHGSNNYPGRDHNSSEFEAFLKAVRKLIGGKDFS